MKKLCLYGLLWLFPIVLCATTYAQTKPMPKTGTVKGRVTGSGDDRPIAGITVRLAGDTLVGTSNGILCIWKRAVEQIKVYSSR